MKSKQIIHQNGLLALLSTLIGTIILMWSTVEIFYEILHFYDLITLSSKIYHILLTCLKVSLLSFFGFYFFTLFSSYSIENNMLIRFFARRKKTKEFHFSSIKHINQVKIIKLFILEIDYENYLNTHERNRFFLFEKLTGFIIGNKNPVLLINNKVFQELSRINDFRVN